LTKSKKRIAILIDTLNGGGAEKVCLTLFEAMLARGVDAHLIVLKRKLEYDLPESKNIHFIFNNDKLRLYSYFVQKRAARKLNELVAQLGSFDALVSNLDFSHAVLAKSELQNCFYVVHNSIEKTLETHRRLGPIKYWRKKRAINHLNGKRLITVSEGIKREIINAKTISPLDVHVIYNPIDLEQLIASSTLPDHEVPDRPYILFMGRIAKQKRVDILIQAFQFMKTDVDLVILTSNLKKLNKLIAKHNHADKKIIGLNFKQNPYPIVKNAQALVLSSDFEGLGMVLIEALACGTPAVSTDCPHGPNEILTGDLEQFLAPVGNPEKLAEKTDLAIDYEVNQPDILNKVTLNRVVESYLRLLS